MLNLTIGDRVEMGGREYLKTRTGASGHAIYGPYAPLDPGRYSVGFVIKPADRTKIDSTQLVVAVDVISHGDVVHAKSLVFGSQIDNLSVFTLNFDITDRVENFQARVFVNGCIPLMIGDDPLVGLHREDASASRLNPAPEIIKTHPDQVLSLFAIGAEVKIIGDDLIGKATDVAFFVRTQDDLNFVGEVFFKSIYNVLPPKPTCLIDIGMNIGFTSLLLARQDRIVEVHSYEPFTSTFDRAIANISLNPSSKAKIRANNFGLSDRNEAVTTLIDTDSSGSFSVFSAGQGTKVKIEIRDASTILGPIIAAARSQGRLVILKVDCEGSEFPVFKSLEKSRLLEQVHGFMVEWHTVWGKLDDLTAPLLRAGYAIMDLSPPTGNGFFYAFRVAN